MAMNIGNPDARLPYLDSVHDFWKERKRAAAGLPETQKARPDEEDSTDGQSVRAGRRDGSDLQVCLPRS